jgi:hypothetical protein
MGFTLLLCHLASGIQADLVKYPEPKKNIIFGGINHQVQMNLQKITLKCDRPSNDRLYSFPNPQECFKESTLFAVQ